MSMELILLGLALVFGLYTAWSIGANDVANAIGTSVGSGALTLRRAVVLAALLEFGGAYLAGGDVSRTVMQGLIRTDLFVDDQLTLVYGMLGSLLAAGVWLQLASYYGWPVSTTHSIIGAIVGFGAAWGGIHAVNWTRVGYIASSWIISPLLGGALAFTFFNFLNRQIFFRRRPLAAAKRVTPPLVFVFVTVLALYFIYKILRNFNFEVTAVQGAAIALSIGSVAGFLAYVYVNRLNTKYKPPETAAEVVPAVDTGLQKALKHLERARRASSGDLRFQLGLLREEVEGLQQAVEERHKEKVDSTEYQLVERIFAYLQMMSACMMAFGHGANDVANAIGPLAAVVAIIQDGAVGLDSSVPPWILALGGFGIVVGLATWGWRVIDTIGKKITELTPSRGFAAEFGAATTILVASRLGLPISTTHTLVGAVLGVGLARGIGALNLNTVRDIVMSWAITLPAGAGLAICFFYTLKGIFG